MSKFKNWCVLKAKIVNDYDLCTLYADDAKLGLGVAAVAKVVPHHYASEERIADLLKRLGKKKTAKFILQKVPISKSIRSGDLGEILCASYVTELTKFDLGVNRLRWKDHRNMAMRGDDILAVRKSTIPGKVKFLKGEVKSSVSLTAATVAKARAALIKCNNRPSPHALSFLADRLHNDGHADLGDLIDDAQLTTGIKLSQISHLLFTFSGNDPKALLQNDLNAYKGNVAQYAVGLMVKGHQTFIKDVYERVIADGGNS